jgi:hypothetical protein
MEAPPPIRFPKGLLKPYQEEEVRCSICKTFIGFNFDRPTLAPELCLSCNLTTRMRYPPLDVQPVKAVMGFALVIGEKGRNRFRLSDPVPVKGEPVYLTLEKADEAAQKKTAAELAEDSRWSPSKHGPPVYSVLPVMLFIVGNRCFLQSLSNPVTIDLPQA